LAEVPDFKRSFIDAGEHSRLARTPAQTGHRFLPLTHTNIQMDRQNGNNTAVTTSHTLWSKPRQLEVVGC